MIDKIKELMKRLPSTSVVVPIPLPLEMHDLYRQHEAVTSEGGGGLTKAQQEYVDHCERTGEVFDLMKVRKLGKTCYNTDK